MSALSLRSDTSELLSVIAALNSLADRLPMSGDDWRTVFDHFVGDEEWFFVESRDAAPGQIVVRFKPNPNLDWLIAEVRQASAQTGGLRDLIAYCGSARHDGTPHDRLPRSDQGGSSVLAPAQGLAPSRQGADEGRVVPLRAPLHLVGLRAVREQSSQGYRASPECEPARLSGQSPSSSPLAVDSAELNHPAAATPIPSKTGGAA